MAEIAKYVRIFNANPADDFVAKRVLAVNAIEAAIKKKVSTNEILEFANGLVSAIEQPEQTNAVVNGVSVAALKKNSAAFVPDDEQLQLLTCTLVAVIQYLEKAKAYAQKPNPEFILAVALWSGLSFQKPIQNQEKLESLRLEVLQTATKIAQDIAHTSRNRKETKPRTPITAPAANTFAAFVTDLEASYGKLVDAYRTNALLDREEIDILWWILGGWSSLCKLQISSLNPIQSVLVSSIEIGKLLQRFPATAHTHLVCKGLAQGDEYNAQEVLEQLGALREKLIINYDTKEVTRHFPKIFPVSGILLRPNEFPVADIKRPLHEWGARLLLEVSLLNINKFAE